MSSIREQYDKLVENTTLPRPVFEIKKSSYRDNDLVATNTNKVDLAENCKDIDLRDVYLSNTNIKFNRQIRDYQIGIDYGDFLKSVINSSLVGIQNFIEKHSIARRPRQTAMYRFWRDVSFYSVMDRTDIDNILYSTWVYLRSNDDETHIKNSMALLEALREKYKDQL